MRGLHYQLPPDNEAKFIKCVKGKIFDVFVDLRKDSPTFLEWVGVELSAENMKMALMPEGFAHGFVSLEDNSEAIYMSSTFYAPQSERGIRFNDPRINIEWPIPVEIYTDKDISHPDIAEDFEGIEIESFLAKVN
ncbi:UNVERIFIED_CONTAM: hypothetical protein GTU68_005007 [Idotea baltica]|nr:hypothetical protein [Idotea baltica]